MTDRQAETVRLPSADHLARAAASLRRELNRTVGTAYLIGGTEDVIRLLHDLCILANPSMPIDAEVRT